jgi:hypothetical protein
MAFRRDPKRSRTVIATMAIVCGLIWAFVGMNDIRTGEAAGYAVFDFIMTLACWAYGVALLKRVDRTPDLWSVLGMIVIVGAPNVKDAIKGFKGGDITFDGAMSLTVVGGCILLAIIALKTLGSGATRR